MDTLAGLKQLNHEGKINNTLPLIKLNMNQQKEVPKYHDIWVKKDYLQGVKLKIVEAYTQDISLFSSYTNKNINCLVLKMSIVESKARIMRKPLISYNPSGDFRVIVTTDSPEAQYFLTQKDNPHIFKEITPIDYVDLQINIDDTIMPCLIHHKTVCKFKENNLINITKKEHDLHKLIITFFARPNTLIIKSNFWDLAPNELENCISTIANDQFWESYSTSINLIAREDASYARVELAWESNKEFPYVTHIEMSCILSDEVRGICWSLIDLINKGVLDVSSIKDGQIWKLSSLY